ncbi:methyltransferase domain containing protein [Nitzschia inconspicua]|uniref:Methyltransferase domain containing protein n=1 Tax=Nitzschia inconspicua TaxID=303405 RepID=A0A9K3KUC7_9STRA|nr:methyltransferase domain containing protein [Nitzschia inconspicua]
MKPLVGRIYNGISSAQARFPSSVLKHQCNTSRFLSVVGAVPERENTRCKHPRICHHLLIRSPARHSSTSTSLAFDRNVKRLQRDNAARARKQWRQTAAANNNNVSNVGDDDDIVDYEYFRQEMALRLVDRLDDIRREEGFPLALDLGSGVGHLYNAISADDAFEGVGGIGGIRKMVQLDSSYEMLHADDDIPLEDGAKERCESYKLHSDEEDKLPFPDGTFDLVLSSQSLHWINDLPNLFKEVFRVLKPDGCFMLSMIGGATLPELRIALTLAEMERVGGVGTHVGPFVELSDVGALMQNAGFALPTIDIDTVEISYPNAAVLMEHLQRMGEGNASLRREQTSRDVFLAASCLYDEMYPLESEEGKDVKASAQVIFAIGWTPHESQQKPLKRGSATHRVGEIVSQHKSDDV